jgi:hypothetical protein
MENCTYIQEVNNSNVGYVISSDYSILIKLELSTQQREEIRQLFLVGGYSSNSQKDTLEESRRIERNYR